MKLIYSIDNINNLNYLLALVFEIRSETGLEPDRIETSEGESVNFSLEDWKRLNTGEITEEEYITKHRRLQ